MRRICLCEPDHYCEDCLRRLEARAERERLEKALLNFREKHAMFQQSLDKLADLAHELSKPKGQTEAE